MVAVNYVVRDGAGNAQRGAFPEGNPATIYVSYTQDVSLNVGPSDISNYTRQGNDLVITLQNGEIIVLSGYYDTGTSGEKNLFLSEEGRIYAVTLQDGADGTVFGGYEAIDVGGKWSAYDELVFLDLGDVEQVVAPLAGGAINGLGALLGGGALVGGAIIGGGGGDDGGGGPIVPTVDDANDTYLLGGDDPTSTTVTGTGTPGSTVVVDIGGNTQTVTIDANGIWAASFDTADLPDDGIYEVVVDVTDPAGNTWTLDGPTIDIDTTGPVIDMTSGVESTGDLVNGDTHTNGTVITGTGEAGASLEVTIDGVTHSTTVDGNGDWSVTFASGEIQTGEYSTSVSITSTDTRGNSTTTTETLVVDTVPPQMTLMNVEGDNTISFAEASDGVTLQGTGEAGASMSVTFQGITRTTTVAADGSWSVDYAAGEITPGTYDADITLSSTDAAGNTSTSSHSVHVDTENALTLNTPIAGDDVINAAEAGAGVSFDGTSEPNATVQVTFQGITRTVTADASGNWTASYASGEIAPGQYDAPIVVTSTDQAGNTETTTGVVHVDTETGVVIAPGQAGGDNIVNDAEASAGVTFNGTAEPGANVQVTVAGVAMPAVVDTAGNWTATYPSGTLPGGQYDTTIAVTSTDAAGNTASTSAPVQIDTEVQNFSANTATVETDGTINAVEHADGVTLTGTVEPGSTVTVQFGTANRAAIVDAAGNWTATFIPGEIPSGTYDAPVIVNATDVAGNTAVINDTVHIDTDITLTSQPLQTADDTINAAEHAAGITLGGSAEAGSTVQIDLLGVTRTVTADAGGNWSVAFTAAEIPEGTYDASATITATDAAGNATTLTETFAVDTEITSPTVDSVTFAGTDVWRIGTQDADGDYTVNTLDANGSVGTPSSTVTQHPALGTEFTFNSAVPDGTNLVVSRTDGAGNSSATLLVLEDGATATTTIGHTGLSGFDVQTLNLEYGDGTNLSLTETDIRDLSNSSDTLTIHGGADDTVTISGATNTGTQQVIDGQIYEVYTLGGDATVIIEQDINVVI